MLNLNCCKFLKGVKKNVMEFSMSSFLQIPSINLRLSSSSVLYSIFSLLHTYYMQVKSNKCFLIMFLCLSQCIGLVSYVFPLYCSNPLALAPTCVVSAPRFPHLHWHNGVLGTTLPRHKLGTKGHRSKDRAAGEQH